MVMSVERERAQKQPAIGAHALVYTFIWAASNTTQYISIKLCHHNTCFFLGRYRVTQEWCVQFFYHLRYINVHCILYATFVFCSLSISTFAISHRRLCVGGWPLHAILRCCSRLVFANALIDTISMRNNDRRQEACRIFRSMRRADKKTWCAIDECIECGPCNGSDNRKRKRAEMY